MTIDTLESDLLDGIKKLLKLAEDVCWNNISDNCLFIVSEIKDNKNNFDEERKIRRALNNKKNPKPLIDLMPILAELYPDFYDINLCIYKSHKKLTIIDIRYYSKNSLDADFRKKVSSNHYASLQGCNTRIFRR